MQGLKLSTLEGLSLEETEKVLSSVFAASSKINDGTLACIVEKIRRLEEFYGTSTQEMLQKIEQGKIQETEELANWAISYYTLQELSGIH